MIQKESPKLSLPLLGTPCAWAGSPLVGVGVLLSMARPIKYNADYFPHDAHMRNDPRILALRRKHGLTGYAVYVMTIEAMSDANHFRLDVSATGREIISGDFGIDQATLDTIFQYCVQIDLFQLSGDVLTCESLNKRFESLINRRVSDAETMQKPAITTQEPYSRVKESKEEKSKGDESKEKTRAWFDSCIDSKFKETLEMTHKGKNVDQAVSEAWVFLSADKHRLKNADPSDVKKLVNTWLGNMKTNGIHSRHPRQKAFDINDDLKK